MKAGLYQREQREQRGNDLRQSLGHLVGGSAPDLKQGMIDADDLLR